MSYKALSGRNDFDEVFNNPTIKIYSENFMILVMTNNEEFKLGMLLPKKNIKLAVHRNYLKRIVRNLSKDNLAESKISLIFVSKKRILNFKKEKLRREIKTLFLNLLKAVE